jgi:acyl carrier protein
MDLEDIVAQVNKIMVEGFEVDPDILTPEATLKDDLGLDSLDGVDLVVALEKSFGCRIAEEDARQIKTLQDIYTHIQNQKQ